MATRYSGPTVAGVSRATSDMASRDRYRAIQMPRGGLLASVSGTRDNPAPPQDPYRMENDDVVDQMNRITSQDSSYMKLARGQGMATANRRGLLNSSMAAGAAEASALQAAAPMAQQNASQIAARNMARGNNAFQLQQTGMTTRSNERIAGMNNQSAETIAASRIASEEKMQGRALTQAEQQSIRQDVTQRFGIETQANVQREGYRSAEGIAAANIASEELRQGRALTQAERESIRNDATQRFGIGTQAETSRYSTDVGAATSRYSTDVGAQVQREGYRSAEDMANARIASEERMQGRALTQSERESIRADATQRFGISTQAETSRYGTDVGAQVQREGYRSAEDMANARIASEERMQGRALTQAERESIRADSTQRFGIETNRDVQREGFRSAEQIATDRIAAEERMQGRTLTQAERESIRNSETQRYGVDVGAATQVAGYRSAEAMAAARIQSEEAMQGRQLTQAERESVRADALSRWNTTEQGNLQRGLLQTEIGSKERMQSEDISARFGLLGAQLSSQETLAREGWDVDLRRTGMTEAGATERARIGEGGATERAKIGVESENARANLAAATQVQITAMNNLNQQQRDQLDFVLQTNSQYTGALNNLYANKDMPAPARDEAIGQFSQIRNSAMQGINLPAIEFGKTLSWGPTATATPTTATAPTIGATPALAAPSAIAPPASIAPQQYGEPVAVNDYYAPQTPYTAPTPTPAYEAPSYTLPAYQAPAPAAAPAPAYAPVQDYMQPDYAQPTYQAPAYSEPYEDYWEERRMAGGSWRDGGLLRSAWD